MESTEHDEPTLSDVMAGDGAPFWVDGQEFRIRQPLPEEYDDALHLQRTVTKRLLALPEIAALKAESCSDGERATYDAMILVAQRQFEEAEDGSAAKRALAERVADLQRAIEKRTLADEVAGERAVLARDRWLTARLLTWPDGTPVFDTHSSEFERQWNRPGLLPLLEAARPAVWAVLGMVQNSPFLLDLLPKRRSG